MSPAEFQDYAEEILKDIGNDDMKKYIITTDADMGNGSIEKCLHFKSRKQCNLCQNKLNNAINDDANLNKDEILCNREATPQNVSVKSENNIDASENNIEDNVIGCGTFSDYFGPVKNIQNVMTEREVQLNYIADPVSFYSDNLLTECVTSISTKTSTSYVDTAMSAKSFLSEKLIPKCFDISETVGILVETKDPDTVPDTVPVSKNEIELNDLHDPISCNSDDFFLRDSMSAKTAIATAAEGESIIPDTVPISTIPCMNYSVLDELM